MQFTHTNENYCNNTNTNNINSVILPLGTDKQLNDSLKSADEMLNGAISAAIKSGDLTGKLNNQHLFLNAQQHPQRILVIGCGKPSELNASKYRTLVNNAWRALKDNAGAQVLSELCLCPSDNLTEQDQVRLTLESLFMSNYQFDQFKSEKSESATDTSMALVAPQSAEQFTQSLATAQAMDLCRDLGNMPGNVCTPTYLAGQAMAMADNNSKLDCQILDEEEMAELGMHCLLSVGKGSSEPSKLIVLNYQGGDQNQAPHVLVGKGITFDTGGISLKPGAAMDEMKYDMCGAASVLATMQAIVAMEAPINVMTIVASAENMPAGNASKPGDIVTTLSGQTVEILNTDAEGRLVLCDALTYAERFEPASVVDVATLTGACIIALGHQTCAMMSNNEALAEHLLKASKQAFDATWQLPLGDEYQEQLKSNFADMANIGGRPAGTITAGCFLARFTKKYPWAHIDIAGTAWTSGGNKGATGRCVPLLVQHLMNSVH